VAEVGPPSAPIGPYRPAVAAGGWIVVSGQLGLADGELVPGGTGPELTQAIANLAAVLRTQGAALSSVVKTTVFLTDMGDFSIMNDAYVAAFGDHRPARSAIGVVALPRGGAVEIEAWAFVGSA
jgi:2-iminobutanoate/2-iminopropanoate deaminase